MLKYEGQLHNIAKQKVKLPGGLEFETVTLQLLDETYRGRSTIVNIYVAKDKLDRIQNLKIGTKVIVPVSVEVSYSKKNERVYTKYWLAN